MIVVVILEKHLVIDTVTRASPARLQTSLHSRHAGGGYLVPCPLHPFDLAVQLGRSHTRVNIYIYISLCNTLYSRFNRVL